MAAAGKTSNNIKNELLTSTFDEIVTKNINSFDNKMRHRGLLIKISDERNKYLKNDQNKKDVKLEKKDDERYQKAYHYETLTILDNEKIINYERKIIDLKNQIKVAERKRDNLISKWESNSDKTQNLKYFHQSLIFQRENITSNRKELEKYIKLESDFNKKQKEQDDLKIEIKKINAEITAEKLVIKKLKSNLKNLQINKKKLIEELKTSKTIKTKEKKKAELENKFQKTIQEAEIFDVLRKIKAINEEIQVEINNKRKDMKKIYEEIIPINNIVYLITTLVHEDESILEEVMYFDQDINNKVFITKQCKKYKNPDEYKKYSSLINENQNQNELINKISLKNFLLHLEMEKLDPSLTEIIIYTTIVLLSIAVVIFPSIAITVLVLVAWEKAVILATSFVVAFIVKTLTSAVSSEITKKIETIIKKNFFDLIRKMPLLKKWSITKTKEEEEIRKKLNDLQEKIVSEKPEVRLSTQFNFWKDKLNLRKQKTSRQLSYEINQTMYLEPQICLATEVEKEQPNFLDLDTKTKTLNTRLVV